MSVESGARLILRRGIFISSSPGRQGASYFSAGDDCCPCVNNRNRTEEQTCRAERRQREARSLALSLSPSLSSVIPSCDSRFSSYRARSRALPRDRKGSIIFISVPFKRLLYV